MPGRAGVVRVTRAPHTPITFRTTLTTPVREFLRLLLLAVVVGAGSGLGAVAFRWLISFFTRFFFVDFTGWTGALHPFNTVIIPALGALIFGPMIWLWAREARGHGVPEVMEAVALRGGRIRPIVAVIKSLASSLNIGSGGAIGREGPIAQIGSALGSSLGQMLRLSPRYLRLLVSAGAGGGIAATFNAPLAGALFGMEVIQREFSPEAFLAIGLSSVVADAVAVPFLGTRPFFVLPANAGLYSTYALLLYLLLGVLAAIVGTAFTKFLYWLEDIFNLWHFHEAFKPAMGGLLLGVIIVLLPPVRGLGYGVMAQVFGQHIGLGRMGLDLGGKFLAASVTLGSGGSGGIFTPTLYMGTMLGDALGVLSNHIWPGLVGSPAGFALVGAAAVFASAARAPITAVVIVMEMSQNYVLAIPLILATVIATRASDLVLADSIYTLKLVRRGVRIFQQQAVDLLQQITVRDAMVTGVPVVAPSAPVAEVTHRLIAERRNALPVVDQDRLRGIVTVADLERAHEDSEHHRLTVADVMVTDVVVAYPPEALREAVGRLNRSEVGQLLVVSPEDPEQLLGMLRRVDVIRAMELKMGKLPDALEPLPANGGPDGAFVQVRVPASSPIARHTLRQVPFPSGMVVVAATRGKHTLAPNGNTLIMPDDHLLIYVVPKSDQHKAHDFVARGPVKAPAPDQPVPAQGDGGATTGTDQPPAGQAEPASPQAGGAQASPAEQPSSDEGGEHASPEHSYHG